MKLVCLEKATALSALCRHFALGEKELLDINDIDAASILPRGMSLLLPTGSKPVKRKLELYVSNQGSGQGVAASGLIHRAGIFAFDGGALPEQKPGAGNVLHLLALTNLDEGGLISPSLAHGLFTDGEAVTLLSQKLSAALGEGGWGGVLLHMEYLFPFDRAGYIDFLAKLEKIVHSAGCWLMVTVPCAAAIAPESREGGAYDIAAIAGLSDRLFILPGKPWDRASLEKCLLALSPLVPMGKLVLGMKPSGQIVRREGTSSLSPIAAHNLAISASACIHRESAAHPAAFEFEDAAGELCRVQYADALCLSGLFGLLGDYGVGGIFCPELHSLAPAASFLFPTLFSIEHLV